MKERQLARQVRIPKAFTLGGTRITVEYKEKLDINDSLAGCALYDELKIGLQKKIARENQEQVFHHELVHHILNKMGEAELRQNEKFVDLFATFLHQYLKTAEY